ncbi:hypothetical protein BMETH_379_0 [methanotrophic bacterial endosymbiont of Bathymodiolus sp.]|nr:hypothetical protein BMETH_379_0 [methanotrophic bacterial endosymbiont of Bathymodiolus sp.]
MTTISVSVDSISADFLSERVEQPVARTVLSAKALREIIFLVIILKAEG